MKITGTIIAMTCLALTACSSSSDDSNGNNSSKFPAQLDQRLVSISTDIDKDGSIDQIERFNYDDMGRIKNKTVEYADDRDDSVTDYIYFDNDLIEIKKESSSIKYMYENGRVVTRQDVDVEFSEYDEQTDYLYDSNGRLVGTLGDTFLYDEFDCSLTSIPGAVVEPGLVAAPGPELGMTLNYDGNRLSTITSDDNVYSASFSYNSNNQFTLLSENYNCFDEVETLELKYDDSGRLVSSTSTDEVYVTEEEFSYDDDGRVIQSVTTDYTGSLAFDERITETYFYNSQNQLSSVESTTEDNDPGFFIVPSYISTYEYENENCAVAISANPLSTVLLDSLAFRINPAGPLLCDYVLQ